MRAVEDTAGIGREMNLQHEAFVISAEAVNDDWKGAKTKKGTRVVTSRSHR